MCRISGGRQVSAVELCSTSGNEISLPEAWTFGRKDSLAIESYRVGMGQTARTVRRFNEKYHGLIPAS